MTSIILATLKHVHNETFELRNDDIQISVKHSSPSFRFCRRALKAHPHLADHSLVVVDEDGKVRFTVKSIGSWAEKDMTTTNAKGTLIVKHRSFVKR